MVIRHNGLQPILIFTLWFCATFSVSYLYAHDYKVTPAWLTPPEGSEYIGNSHGEIAIAGNADVYVSVMGAKGGIQVYGADGAYLRNVPNAPEDIHGFVIKKDRHGQEFIWGVEMAGMRIFKLTLAGRRVLDVDALASIPEAFHRQDTPPNDDGWVPPKLRLTAVDVDSDGYFYVVDGYGLDYIHKFNAQGEYLSTFGGRNAPWSFKNCHKIAVDPRYQPHRLMCADRANHRLVHLTLSGDFIATYAENLRRPSAVDFYKGFVAVAEISGRVTVLDKAGDIVVHLGTNEVADEINKNKTPPEKWKPGIFTSPHGISYDDYGNLYVTEYNKWGRVQRFTTLKSAATP